MDRLRNDHSSLAEDVIERNRFFWLGSGLSRDQAPDLVELIRHALEFLRDRANTANEDAEVHQRALVRILGLHLPDELIRYEEAGDSWVPGDLESTRNSYSQILATRVDTKPGNYLLMDGVNVPARYSDPKMQPGPDHKFIAMLVSEGVLAEMASGNWDGLVERALIELGGGRNPLSVHVIASDIRDANASSWLAKFHGCAVRASENPAAYGPAIVATTAQISMWSTSPDFAHMRNPLIQNVQQFRSLILGLSVQDADLLDVFTLAAQGQPWPWEASNPAYVFAERELSASQEDVLANCYGVAFDASRPEILERSAFGDFSRSLLASLTIYVVVEKAKAAVRRFTGLPPLLIDEFANGLDALERMLVTATRDGYEDLVGLLAGPLSKLVRQFYGSAHFVGSGSYTPLVVGTKAHVEHDPTVTMLRAERFAFVLALLGNGAVRSKWRVRLRENDTQTFIEVSRPLSTPVLLAVVSTAEAADEVLQSSSWALGKETMAIIHADGGGTNPARSSGSRLGSGRGASQRREIRLPDLLAQVDSVEQALENLFAGGGA